jgi:hypothetical protein
LEVAFSLSARAAGAKKKKKISSYPMGMGSGVEGNTACCYKGFYVVDVRRPIQMALVVTKL